MSTFSPLIPTGLVNLDSDYKNIQNNMQQLDTTYGTDHFAFSNQTAQNGIHKQVTLVNEAAPGLGSGTGVLYANTISGNSWPIWQNALGSTVLISGPTTATPNNGTTFLSGGIILKWGFVATTGGSSTLNFAPAFPTALFSVTTSPAYSTLGATPGGSANTIIDTNPATFLNTGFKWVFTTGSGSYTGFYWFALGN